MPPRSTRSWVNAREGFHIGFPTTQLVNESKTGFKAASGIIFDHCKYPVKAFKRGDIEICKVFGPTCDALDVLSMSEELPTNLELGDLVYSRNIGAYSNASATSFNGFSPAKIVHINQ